MSSQRGLVQRIERKLEATVGDAFARIFGGSIVPQEVEAMLRREAEDGVRTLHGNRLLAPNEYIITLGVHDFDQVGAESELTSNAFAKYLAGYIQEQGWQTYGDVVVRFEQSSNLHTGQFRARGTVNPDVEPRPAVNNFARPQSNHAFGAEPGVPAMTDNPSYRGQGQGRPGDEYYDDRYGRPQDEPRGGPDMASGQDPRGGFPPDPGGYPTQHGYPPPRPPEQGGYQGGGYPEQAGYQDQRGGYPEQGGYPGGGYQDQGGYPEHGGYPDQGGYQGQRGGYPEQRGYPDQGGYSGGGYQDQRGYSDQRGGYPDQGGYPGGGYPEQAGYQDQRSGYSDQGGYQDQRGGYPDQRQGGYPPSYEQRPADAGGYGGQGYDQGYGQGGGYGQPAGGGQPGYGDYSDYGRGPAPQDQGGYAPAESRPAYPDQGGGYDQGYQQGGQQYGQQDYSSNDYTQYAEASPGAGYAAPGYSEPAGREYDYGQQAAPAEYGQPGGGYGGYGQGAYAGAGTTVTLQLDDGSGRTYQLREGSNIVGRGQDAQFRLPDTGVSRRHLEIRWDGQVALLSDLNSTNGTTVNNAPVQEWQLADADVIRLGHSEIIVRIH